MVDRDRGIADRIGDFFGDDTNNERQLYRALREEDRRRGARRATCAAAPSANTTQMLEGLLGRFGYTDVKVVFEKPAPARTVGAK